MYWRRYALDHRDSQSAGVRGPADRRQRHMLTRKAAVCSGIRPRVPCLDRVEALILGLLEWIGTESRPSSEVMDAWRTSRSHLPVWEAAERGFIARGASPSGSCLGLTTRSSGPAAGPLTAHEAPLAPGAQRWAVSGDEMKRLRRTLIRHGRLATALVGIFAISYGVLQIARGGLSYENYWGGLVFAPFTVLFGALILCISLFRHERIGGAWRDKRRRPIRFPADDFRKW